MLVERMVQMAEMSDAHIRCLEDKDRVAMPLGSAAPVADIGGHVAHAHVLDREVVARRLIRGWPPATQHMLDGWIWPIGEMRAVRVIHRDDVRHEWGPDIIIVVRCDTHELRSLDQEG